MYISFVVTLYNNIYFNIRDVTITLFHNFGIDTGDSVGKVSGVSLLRVQSCTDMECAPVPRHDLHPARLHSCGLVQDTVARGDGALCELRCRQ